MLGITTTIEETGNQAGIPDFTVRKNDNLLGYIEAKKIGENLDKIEQSEQLQRYFDSAIGQNLILTNYLEFRWYIDGKLQLKTTLGKIEKEQIIIVDDAAKTEELIQSFLNRQERVINDYYDLAKQMAAATKAVRYGITESLKLEDEQGELTQLKLLFQDLLLPDLDNNNFADMYAQTIAYGLFTARVGHAQNPGQEIFGRKTASIYISDKIPFLKGLFTTVIETDIVSKINWTIEQLVELLAKVDMSNILENFGRETRQEDPVVHFYETFLAAYEASLRKSRGVYYTPEPVVSFIVRAVNDLLDQEFDLDDGLGSRKVTILDPATGTGTFLYEVIKQIYFNFEKYGVNRWNELLRDKKVLERLYGFELLMTPYTIAHLKLVLLLETLGYRFAEKERLNIYLTNTLEEGVKKSEVLLGKYISEEANKAAAVKTEIPIYVVLGNPPYSVSSQNASKRKRMVNEDTQYLADVQYTGEVWNKIYKIGKAGKIITELTHIGELLERYKGRVRLDGERNIQPLDDDYIKFIRFAHNQIEKTGHGIIGFITNHSYLNGLIHRGMREELLKSFDSLYIIDLHGNSLLKETTPDGEVDQNVFDIQQGVAILIAVSKKSHPDYFSTVYKKREGDKLTGEVFYYDLWGKREDKYKFLDAMNINNIEWVKLNSTHPNFFFSPKDFDLEDEYTLGWSIIDIFNVYAAGVKTRRDNLCVDFDQDILVKKFKDIADNNNIQNLKETYQIRDTEYWTLSNAQKHIKNSIIESHIKTYIYRPFDSRWVYYNPLIIERGDSRWNLMRHMLYENLALLTMRGIREGEYNHFFISDDLVNKDAVSIKDNCYVFPLYTYPDTENQQTNLFKEKKPNLSPEFLTAIKERLGYIPTPETIFYYAYAVFHSPTYRQRYADFLKIDFPRLPLTKNKQLFTTLATQGETLVNLHLMKSEQLNNLITQYQGDGENQVTQVIYSPQLQQVSINKNCQFTGITENVWQFKIGGYQVLDKWLKDRKKDNRKLSNDDIIHYQKIVVALKNTIEIMQEIDTIIPSFPIE
ncbi:adenine specific DNA methyltransferase [Aphanothece sacrum FPU1]|uniref:site-specific DNA-methyltransferase (adenine-specific) n=2 Tax=Aphanothece sacrum TaxID=1122 RepID=A0A401IMY4_APHSA|nr:adenine specific DNA methyltransferase [Aphanothece sacrum FPU1]